ncbi:MAG: succinate dehydrogenase/fumarate reductase iron-sulfur subunit [Thermoplasmatota archaeon]
MKLKIFRYDGDESHYDEFEVPHEPGQTVLDALFYIQENLDDSLSFRYSCRGAVCGSCAMLINKIPRLACRTQVKTLVEGEDKVKLKHYPALDKGEDIQDGTVLVEPLPHLPVEKDLIVDQDKFFEYYREMEPILKTGNEVLEKEYEMDPEDVSELEDYTNCILCAACFGACPVDGENKNYRGPAALAKLYRFHIDPRDNEDRLKLADHEDGWWACEFHTNCQKVCPKNVPPNIAIGKARSKLQKEDE